MISVVIAAYNGGKYIKAQLDSVLSQLSDGDEVVISDDLPDGDTFDVVKEYLDSDARRALQICIALGIHSVTLCRNHKRCCLQGL